MLLASWKYCLNWFLGASLCEKWRFETYLFRLEDVFLISDLCCLNSFTKRKVPLVWIDHGSLPWSTSLIILRVKENWHFFWPVIDDLILIAWRGISPPTLVRPYLICKLSVLSLVLFHVMLWEHVAHRSSGVLLGRWISSWLIISWLVVIGDGPSVSLVVSRFRVLMSILLLIFVPRLL